MLRPKPTSSPLSPRNPAPAVHPTSPPLCLCPPALTLPSPRFRHPPALADLASWALRHTRQLIATSLTLAATTHAQTTTWPQFRGPAASATLHAPGLPLELDDTVLVPAWRQPVGGGYSGITIAAGHAYTMDRPRGENTERVLCFHLATGDLAWTHTYPADYAGLEYGSGPRASVTLHAGSAYTLGATGHLHCLDAGTGAVTWHHDTTSSHDAQRPSWGFAATPVVYRQTLITHIGARPGGCYVTFDLATGKELWRAASDPAGYSTPTLTKHQGRDLMLAWTPQHIRGIDPADGTLLWSHPYKIKYGVAIHMPVLHRGTALVSGYWHGTRAIRLGDKPGDAQLAWENQQTIRGLMAQPLAKDGTVYLLDRSNGLTAFEIETGKRLWDDAVNHTVTPADRNPHASLVWLNSNENPDHPTTRALAFNANGELLSLTLTPAKLTLHSRHQLSAKTWAHPAYTATHIVTRTDTHISAHQIR